MTNECCVARTAEGDIRQVGLAGVDVATVEGVVCRVLQHSPMADLGDAVRAASACSIPSSYHVALTTARPRCRGGVGCCAGTGRWLATAHLAPAQHLVTHGAQQQRKGFAGNELDEQ